MHYPDDLNAEQVEGYLARLELTAPLSADLENLNRLLFAQLTHIPFDSLDVWGAGICPSLQICDLYEKMIVKKRGGSIYSLDGKELKLYTEWGTQVIPVETVDQLKNVLLTYFDIDPATVPLRNRL